jgi:hypothetical protein
MSISAPTELLFDLGFRLLPYPGFRSRSIRATLALMPETGGSAAVAETKATKTREELEQEWWVSWWVKDYSWDGLARKKWTGWSIAQDGTPILKVNAPEGSRDATLQDYWRDEEPNLIPEYGDGGVTIRRWTRIHLPITWRNGSPTEKPHWEEEQWTKLDAVILARLEGATETWNPRVKDGRAQLTGAVLRAIPSSTRLKLHVDAARAACLAATLLDEQAFGPNAAFSDALFSDDASFDRTSFQGRAIFDSATFLAKAGFERAIFRGDAFFGNVTFWGNSVFASAAFLNGARAMFEGASFSGYAEFDNATFSTDASFYSTTFSRRVKFESAVFSGVTSFGGASYLDDARYNKADFHAATSIFFRSSRFEAQAHFRDTKWPAEATAYSSAFRDVMFPRFADFRGDDFTAFASFDGAKFGAEARFSPSIFINDKALRATLKAAGGKDEHLLALESGFRVLKLGAENVRDRLTEQRFYRYELICRRKQSTTALSERIVSHLYAWLGDYGASMGRPICNVIFTWLCFAALYWGLAWLADPSRFAGLTLRLFAPVHPSILDALDLSAHVIFAPFGVWAASFPVSDFDKALLENAGPGMGLVIRLIASLESILAVALLFLSGLAIRRRFQIN